MKNAFLGLLFFILAPSARASHENEPLPPFKLQADFRDKIQAMNDFAALKTDRYEDGDGAQVIPADGGWEGDEIFEWSHVNKNALTVLDDDIGFRLLPLSQTRRIYRTKQKLIYDVVETRDEWGRRYTWTPPNKAQALHQPENFLILMGCSFVFGEGVSDKETLSYKLSEKMWDYAPYNYGFSGTAPNSYLAMIQSGRFAKEIPQKKGVLVYVSLDAAHVVRSSGYLDSLKWLRHSPYYEEEHGQLVRHGSFLTGRPILTKLLLFYERIRVYFGVNPNQDFPRLFGFNYDHYCSLVKGMRDEFLKQYPDSKFLVYMHPVMVAPSPQIMRCFRKNNIDYVLGRDLSSEPGMYIPRDGHPTGLANETIAEELKSVIQKGF